MYLKGKTFPFVKDNQIHERENEEYPKCMDFRGSRMSGFLPVRVIGPTVSSRCDGCPLSQYLGDVLAYLF